MSLCGLGANNIYHWYNDILPQVMRAEERELEGTYIVPAGPSWIGESLKLLGIREDRLHHFLPGVLEIQGDLIVPERINLEENQSPYSDLMRRLREQTLSNLESNVSEKLKSYISELTENGKKPLKLHIVRRPDGTMGEPRFPTNYEELEVTLARAGFIAVDMSKLPLASQIYLASNADALAGPHGAGFTHCMWLKRGAQIIEFFGDSYHLDCYEFLSKNVFGLTYDSITGAASEYGSSDHRPFHVPIDQVKAMLNSQRLQ